GCIVARPGSFHFAVKGSRRQVATEARRVHAGILPDSQIAELYRHGAIAAAADLDAGQVQPASLDLRLGNRAWRVRASFLPGPENCVTDKLGRLSLHEFSLANGAVLETGCVYVVELQESLALPETISATSNPKSSTGRLDIFTRIMADRCQEFDHLPAGYRGPLYIEISPRTFPIVVRSGSRLAQIRFRTGPSQLDDAGLLDLHRSETLVTSATPNISSGGIALSVDLSGNAEGLIGYRGKRHTGLVDVDCRDTYPVLDF